MNAWKRLSFGLGIMAVGLATGCQGTGTQLVNPGVLRGESAVYSSANSPAYAQIAGGRNLPAPVFAGQPMPPMQAMGNGAVMPNGTVMMPGVTQVAHGQQMGGMPTMQPGMGMANMPSMGNMPTMPNMPAMTPSGSPSMNGSVMVVNGPAGPQYVYVEMLGPVMPGTGSNPSSSVSLPTLPPTIVTPDVVKDAPSAPPAPSFDAPAPTAIPLPMLPSGRGKASEDTKVPEILPPVGLKTSGSKSDEPMTIPVGHKVEGPALPPLNLPALPPPAKLAPTPMGSSEIPPAPIFVPAAN
jgi:hypothetical protein